MKDSKGQQGYRSGDAFIKLQLVDVNDDPPVIDAINGKVRNNLVISIKVVH